MYVLRQREREREIESEVVHYLSVFKTERGSEREGEFRACICIYPDPD